MRLVWVGVVAGITGIALGILAYVSQGSLLNVAGIASLSFFVGCIGVVRGTSRVRKLRARIAEENSAPKEERV